MVKRPPMTGAERKAKGRRVHGYQPIDVTRITRVEISALRELLPDKSADAAVRQAVVHYRKHLSARQAEVTYLETQNVLPPATKVRSRRKAITPPIDESKLESPDNREQGVLFQAIEPKTRT